LIEGQWADQIRGAKGGGMNLQTGSTDRESNSHKSRILLVDDDVELLTVTQVGLEKRGFEVVAATTVNDALGRISSEHFDVLLSDLHMPNPGDGYTVVSAMHHRHPKAITLVLSGFPAVQEAAKAILQQADEVLLKPIGVAKMTEIINKRLANPREQAAMNKIRVSEILERDSNVTIQAWLSRLANNAGLTSLPLTDRQRTEHLPLLLADLVGRLRDGPSGQVADSTTAYQHGARRYSQGYTIAMMVEESRMLQVCIFNTLQNNLSSVDFDNVLIDVMTIADEVDSQLKQAVLGFTESAKPQDHRMQA
jgi:CheY-like chemotaxis protein